LQQHTDIMAIDFNADRFLSREGLRLMRCLREHRSEAEKLPCARLVDDYFLIILINGRHADGARNNDVGAQRGLAYLVYTLPRAERLLFDLRCQNCQFIIIEQTKEWDLFEGFDITGHGSVSGISVMVSAPDHQRGLDSGRSIAGSNFEDRRASS